MSMTYSIALKSARMQAIVDTAGANAKLEFGTTGMVTVLASFTFGAVLGVVSGDTLTFSGLPMSDTFADATGIATEARIRTAGDVDVITGLTVSTSAGSDVVLDNANINSGQTITINSIVLKHG